MKITEEYKQDLILLGQHIKKLREEKSFTLEELALKTGIKLQYLQKIEEGTAYGLSMTNHLLKIVQALKINWGILFRFENI